jgi:GDP-L-fucose synthase
MITASAQAKVMPSKIFDLTGKRVFVAGHRGMVGSAIVRRLAQIDCTVITAERSDLDLVRQEATERFLRDTAPDVVIVAAARVGGIHANSAYPAQFIYDNLAIGLNIIHGAHKAGIAKLLFLGSSCIYPRVANQPMCEEELMRGPLEPTNEWYAVAKIAGIKLCQAYRREYGADYISVMPTNLYGLGDNYHPEKSHVVPALIRRFHEAMLSGVHQTTVWGTGTPRREFLFADDLADACRFVLEHYSDELHLNVGSGQEVTIGELAHIVGDVVGYRGEIVFDPSRPDGTPRKLLDITRLTNLGWVAPTKLRVGLGRVYADFLSGSGSRQTRGLSNQT